MRLQIKRNLLNAQTLKSSKSAWAGLGESNWGVIRRAQISALTRGPLPLNSNLGYTAAHKHLGYVYGCVRAAGRQAVICFLHRSVELMV